MRLYFHTLGCKVNQYETQAMRRAAEAAGFATGAYRPGEECPEAAAVVVNSCTVTGESDRKLRQLLRRIRREVPGAAVVLTGCFPQAFPHEAEALAEADVVLGNAARRALPRHIQDYLVRRQRIVDIPPHTAAMEPLAIEEFEGRTRAFVKIEDGCDNFCAYCIIPTARGRVRSKPLDALRSEVAALVARGYVECVLVGINLTAYGRDEGWTLADAVEAAAAVPGIARVRLGSLEPDALTPVLLDRLAAQDKLCPQFHVSLQSGCAATLRRMNRRYTPEEYAAVCDGLRRRFPGCALTTDVMVGFPGETAEEFTQSREFVRRIGFAQTHVFAYSRRPRTRADRMPDQVSARDKQDRSHDMAAVCAALRAAYLDAQMDSVQEVLLETSCTVGGWEGYTRAYVPVRVADAPGLGPGQLVRTRLTGRTQEGLEGRAEGIAE